jgi:hypothetical protein
MMMTVGGLRQKYREVFGEEFRSNHKDFLFRRIAWRLQANAVGGLSERARRRALEIANDADLRIRAPKDVGGSEAGHRTARRAQAEDAMAGSVSAADRPGKLPRGDPTDGAGDQIRRHGRPGAAESSRRELLEGRPQTLSLETHCPFNNVRPSEVNADNSLRSHQSDRISVFDRPLAISLRLAIARPQSERSRAWKLMMTWKSSSSKLDPGCAHALH